MKNLYELNEYRITSDRVLSVYGFSGDETCGVFEINSCIDRSPMIVIAATGKGWEHCSVSRKKRTPNWYEMSQIKKMFFEDDEVVMQLHVPSKDHINLSENCLHLWRPQKAEIPLPPKEMV